jgi:hypothetical protein
MNVTFENNLGFTQNDLYFNVWANSLYFTEAGGDTLIRSVKVNGKPSAFSLNETALHITRFHLAARSIPKVQITFTVRGVPERQDRFGWYGTTVSLDNWFPILAVYDEEGWNTDPYYSYRKFRLKAHGFNRKMKGCVARALFLRTFRAAIIV